MARNLQVALTLLAKDAASKVLRKVMQDSIRQQQEAGKASDQLGNTQKRNSDSSIRASRSLQAEFRRAASARESLGIRSEKTIQREIQLTIAAYGRLTRTGKLSASEQGRAFQAMTERVSRLRTELTGAGQAMSKMDRARQWGSNIGAVAGGVMAAGAVIADPVKRQMAYDSRNAEMVNTGYNELSPNERIQKIPVINNAIKEAVRYGGGTPEAAQETLNSIFAGGQVDNETAIKILPDIMRYSTASGANPEQLAKIASAAIANFGIKPEELPSLFDKSIRSGENGSFELPDMASELPEQMSMARSIGMSGLADYEKLLALNQANSLTAGGNSEAATNVKNLLGKISSADTQNALKNYRFRGEDGKPLKYTNYLAEQRKKGVSTPDAFMNAVSGIVSADKRVQKLRQEAVKYKGTDREKDILASLDVVVGSITSKIIADAQAGMALKTNIQQKDFINKQLSGTKNAEGAGADSFAVVSSTTAFKSQQFESEKLFAEQDSIKPIADLYGDLTVKLTDYMREYPELTTALSVATTAIKTMTVAATAFATLRFLTGAGGIRVPGAAAGAAAAAGSASSGIGGRLASGFGRLAGRIAAPLALWQAAEDAPLLKVQRGDAEARKRLEQGNYTSSLDRLKDADAARPGLKDAWDEVKSWWSPPTSIGKELQPGFGSPSYLTPPQQQSQPFQQPFIITNKIELDGQQIAESVNTVNSQQSVRGPTGGPQ